MTPKEITTLAHHRLVPPWVMKLVLEATAIERENALEKAAKVCDEVQKDCRSNAFTGAHKDYVDGREMAANICAAAIRGLK